MLRMIFCWHLCKLIWVWDTFWKFKIMFVFYISLHRVRINEILFHRRHGPGKLHDYGVVGIPCWISLSFATVADTECVCKATIQLFWWIVVGNKFFHDAECSLMSEMIVSTCIQGDCMECILTIVMLQFLEVNIKTCLHFPPYFNAGMVWEVEILTCVLSCTVNAMVADVLALCVARTLIAMVLN